MTLSASSHPKAILTPPPFLAQGHARCREVDPEIFWPVFNRPEDWAKPRSVCMACALRKPCLQWALEIGANEGMWGATTPHERKAIRRDSRRRELDALQTERFGRVDSLVSESVL